MAGDFSRNTFDPRKHYSSVLMQQGRVQLDADWNEQQAIQQHHLETTARDVIGPSGAPSHNPGFAIEKLLDESGNFQIGPGHYYVDGILCENEAAVSYSGQPDLPAVKPLTTGFYLAYLDVWRRPITALDDPLIREVALGGPDTTTRLKTVWQVRVLPVSVASEAEALQKTESAEWNAPIVPSTGMLNARTIPFAEPEPCLLPPSSGYQRLENQLYRVEIHQGGDHEKATFKWSRENASITTGIQKITGNVITVTDLGKDEILGFAVGQWVEIVDDEAELMQAPYSLAQIVKIDPSTREITLSLSSEMTFPISMLEGKPSLKLRRWDQTGDAASQDGLSVKQALVWSELEGGIQVQFSAGSYRSGDYWLIPARTATGDIEWPRDSAKPEPIKPEPIPQPPVGIQHHYCRLALLRFDGTKLSVLKDCRQIFPPATKVTADYIGYTPSCNPGPQTVAAFLDTLFYRKEDKELAPLIRALLSLKGRDVTVREGLNWLAEALEKRTGMVTVGEGGCYEDLKKAFEALASTKDYEVALLLLPGEHKLPANYTPPGKCSSIKLEGAGTRASTIQLDGNLTLKADEIILSDLTIQATRNRQSITLEGEKITATRCSFNKNINNFLAARILGNTQKYGESSLTVNSLAVDKDNNILVAGIFHGMVNFGDDKLTRTSLVNDIFVAKYNSKLEHYKSLALTDMYTNMQPGNTLSVKDMTVDDQGNILVTGQLRGTIKFKFDDSDSYLSSAKEDGFIAKLNSELGYSKLRLLAKTEFYANSMFNVVAMTMDQNEILIIGDFFGTINFGELDANKLSSTAYNNSFIVRLGSDLKYLNSACIDNTVAINVTGIAVNRAHQIFVTGKRSEGGFIVKLDKDLKSIIIPPYILKTEQNSTLTVSGIAVDNENNVLVTGKFMGTVTMKSGDKLTSSLEKGFIVKLTPDLNLYRTRTLDGVFDRISRISIDINGNVVLTGIFSSNISFEDDSDNNSVKLSSQVPCGFIVVFDRYLKPLWARSSNTKAVDLAIDNVGNIVITGQFRGALKLGDDSTAELKSEQEDGFIAKFGYTESPLVNIVTPQAGELKFADNHIEVLWSWKDNTGTNELISKPWEGLVLDNHKIGGSIQDNYILGQVTLRGKSPGSSVDQAGSSVDQFIPLDSQTFSEGLPSAINPDIGKNIQLKGNEIYCLVSKVDRTAMNLYAPNVIMATNNIFTANENSFICESLTLIANYFPNAKAPKVAATVIGKSGIFVGNAAQDRGATIMRNLVEKEGLWIANLLSYVDPSVSLSPASMSFNPNGSTTEKINVTAGGSWYVEVDKNLNWINLIPSTSQSGDRTKVSCSGNAIVNYAVLPNGDKTSRTATLRIASSLSNATLAQFTITQAGLSVTPTEIPFVVQDGSGDIKVSAPLGWVAKSNVDWIKISAIDNSVDGLVRYQVLKNTGQNLDTSPRTGTMTIAGQTVTINQVGGSVSIGHPASVSFDQSGCDPRTVQITATPGHEWEAKPSDTWIGIQSGKGTGDGSFSYKVISLPTGQNERRGFVSVNGQIFSITQRYIVPVESG